ncbi:MAG TPA: DUF3073 domain-containing protein [Pseudonocardia sp.]|jgi:hypothetical protein|nr:DUF3073 domain-containing protein [Pseudonocardia sp.]
MGRGRAKAKQTKVARELKYSSPGLDALALQRELGGIPASEPEKSSDDELEFEDDEYQYRNYR